MSFEKLGVLSGLILALALQSSAAEWYVSRESGKNKNDGASPATALRTFKKRSTKPPLAILSKWRRAIISECWTPAISS